MHDCARAQRGDAFRIRFAGFNRLPVFALIRERREPKQRERRFAGVSVSAKDDEIGHADIVRRGGVVDLRNRLEPRWSPCDNLIQELRDLEPPDP